MSWTLARGLSWRSAEITDEKLLQFNQLPIIGLLGQVYCGTRPKNSSNTTDTFVQTIPRLRWA